MSDSIVACNSSYWSLLIAPQPSKACHFWSWSMHSDLMLTLHPGDVTKVAGAVLDVVQVVELDVVAEDLTWYRHRCFTIKVRRKLEKSLFWSLCDRVMLSHLGPCSLLFSWLPCVSSICIHFSHLCSMFIILWGTRLTGCFSSGGLRSWCSSALLVFCLRTSPKTDSNRHHLFFTL